MILRSADGSRRMMKILRIMNGNLRVTRTKIQVKTAQLPHKLSRKILIGDNGKVTVSECENIPYSIESRTHSKSGATIFAVLFSKEIEAAGERKFVQTARDFNGYWSDFGKGRQTTSRDASWGIQRTIFRWTSHTRTHPS